MEKTDWNEELNHYLKKANCAALVRLKNSTQDILHRTDFILPSGMWRKFPPQSLEPDLLHHFGTESFGVCTGTEGTVLYQRAKGEKAIQLEWSVPFLGVPQSNADCGENYIIRKEITGSKPVIFDFQICEPNNSNNQRPASGILEAPIIYETWKMELKSANKSVLVTVSNITDYKLFLVSSYLSSGIWRSPVPEEVPPQTNAEFGVESHGYLTIKGHVTYELITKKKKKLR